MLIPTCVQIIHAFKSHHHTTNCKVVTTHLHKKELDCPLCKFHISIFDIALLSYSEKPLKIAPLSYLAYYKSNKYNSIKPSLNLRGPPMF